MTARRSRSCAFHRGTLDKRNRYFGPFPSAAAVRDGIATLQKVFMLRTCEPSVFQNRSRPVHAAPDPALHGALRRLRQRGRVPGGRAGGGLFLQGKTDEARERLQAQMEAASAKLAFERAARLRDKIARLATLQSRQFVESSTAGDIDVVAAVGESNMVAVNVVMIRGGRHVGDRTFFPRNAEAAPDRRGRAGVPRAALSRAAGAADDRRAGRGGSRGARGRARRAVGPRGRDRRESGRRAARLAQDGDRERDARDSPAPRAEGDGRGAARGARSRRSACPRPVQRIECFDVSHTMGEAATASCVIFDQLQMRNNEYRRFNVSPPTGGDDYAAMREALTRRCARIVAGEFPRRTCSSSTAARGRSASPPRCSPSRACTTRR
jgi:excinuclease ABC subunit C